MTSARLQPRWRAVRCAAVVAARRDRTSGTAIPVAHGGSGLGLTELALMLEEQGRTLARSPAAGDARPGRDAPARFGTPAQQRLLPQVAAGELLLTAALEETAGGDPWPVSARLPRAAGVSPGSKHLRALRARRRSTCSSRRAPGAGVRVFLVPRDCAGRAALRRSAPPSGEPQGQ